MPGGGPLRRGGWGVGGAVSRGCKMLIATPTAVRRRVSVRSNNSDHTPLLLLCAHIIEMLQSTRVYSLHRPSPPLLFAALGRQMYEDFTASVCATSQKPYSLLQPFPRQQDNSEANALCSLLIDVMAMFTCAWGRGGRWNILLKNNSTEFLLYPLW